MSTITLEVLVVLKKKQLTKEPKTGRAKKFLEVIKTATMKLASQVG
jgi:hypothetical protein